MADLVEITGGDGVPAEPNWSRYFGRKADRDPASEHRQRVISEMRGAEKLAVVNTHAIQRLIVAYVTFDISAKAVLKVGPVVPAPKTKVPTYNPWWTTMQNAAATAAALEKELRIYPRDRKNGGKVAKKATRTTGGGYLKSRG
ncbi:P27 family phage terminase small subunit [Novosphingobium sp. 9U]|uniref:P27 family phage terminase small subunit n=1 Tax=Novosphingobium sp. 9U TaxID=2653158 RepID=UPI0012EF178C|nr:P27 family phage terminase small subunit [Novosphingobium sp. 9U]VWX53301.1 Phage terminase, small subunit [Novosphingobium sp. 9U]